MLLANALMTCRPPHGDERHVAHDLLHIEQVAVEGERIADAELGSSGTTRPNQVLPPIEDRIGCRAVIAIAGIDGERRAGAKRV